MYDVHATHSARAPQALSFPPWQVFDRAPPPFPIWDKSQVLPLFDTFNPNYRYRPWVPSGKPLTYVSGLRDMARLGGTYPRKILHAIRAGKITGAHREGHHWVAPRPALLHWAVRNPTAKYRKGCSCPRCQPAA